MKNDIARLIAMRDNISFSEAYAEVKECANLMEDAIARGNYQECEDILREELGLEPDYMDGFLF